MSEGSLFNKGRLGIALSLLFVLAVSGCKPKAAVNVTADTKLQLIAGGISAFRHTNNKDWPETLQDIVGTIAPDPNDKDILANPTTGDSPGYEYVKPNGDDDMAKQVVVYQLRSGKRDTSMPALFGDGKIHKIE